MPNHQKDRKIEDIQHKFRDLSRAQMDLKLKGKKHILSNIVVYFVCKKGFTSAADRD